MACRPVRGNRQGAPTWAAASRLLLQTCSVSTSLPPPAGLPASCGAALGCWEEHRPPAPARALSTVSQRVSSACPLERPEDTQKEGALRRRWFCGHLPAAGGPPVPLSCLRTAGRTRMFRLPQKMAGFPSHQASQWVPPPSAPPQLTRTGRAAGVRQRKARAQSPRFQ